MPTNSIVRIVFVAFCLLGLLGCVTLMTEAKDQGWAERRVKEGKKNYAPGHGLGIQPMTDGYDLTFCVPAKAWYDPSVLGSDKKDWLKVGGISYFSIFQPSTWAKNHDSPLVAFRMLSDSTYEYCAYVNDLSGAHFTGLETKAALGDTITIKYRYEQGRAYYMTDYPALRDWTYPIGWGHYQIAVGPWHGGTTPAPKETYLFTKFKYVRIGDN